MLGVDIEVGEEEPNEDSELVLVPGLVVIGFPVQVKP